MFCDEGTFKRDGTFDMYCFKLLLILKGNICLRIVLSKEAHIFFPYTPSFGGKTPYIMGSYGFLNQELLIYLTSSDSNPRQEYPHHVNRMSFEYSIVFDSI